MCAGMRSCSCCGVATSCASMSCARMYAMRRPMVSNHTPKVSSSMSLNGAIRDDAAITTSQKRPGRTWAEHNAARTKVHRQRIATACGSLDVSALLMSPLCGGVISADAMECVVSRSRFFALDCGCQIAVMGYITRRAPYQRRTFSTENWKDPMPASLPESNDPSAPPEIHRPVVFVIVCLAILMTTIDATIVATALDALKDGLDTTINWAGWTMTAYMFGFVLMLPITGVLTQRYGRRRVFIASVAMFTLTSVACGFAPDIYTLIAMRLLQAMGGAGLTPSATAIVVDYFGDVRDRATSLFGSMFPIGEIIGPVFGGIFVTYLTWSDIFFMNVPIGIFILLLAYRFIPPDPPIDRTKLQPFDYKGMLLLSFGLLTGMYATTMLGDASAGVQSPHFWVPLAASVRSEERRVGKEGGSQGGTGDANMRGIGRVVDKRG